MKPTRTHPGLSFHAPPLVWSKVLSSQRMWKYFYILCFAASSLLPVCLVILEILILVLIWPVVTSKSPPYCAPCDQAGLHHSWRLTVQFFCPCSGCGAQLSRASLPTVTSSCDTRLQTWWCAAPSAASLTWQYKHCGFPLHNAAQIRVSLQRAMDQKRKLIFLEHEITVKVEEAEARRHTLFSGMMNKAKQAVWECVTAAVNKVEHKDTAMAQTENKQTWLNKAWILKTWNK